MKSHNGIKVKDCKNIQTSFPNFIELMNNLGGNLSESLNPKSLLLMGPLHPEKAL